MDIDLRSPRPLADAVLLLEQRLQRVITYEDVPCLNPGDLSQDEGGRVIPRGGAIRVDGAEDLDIRDLIGEVLQAHVRAGNPGVFGLEQVRGVYHVVPEKFRNAEGVLQERLPLVGTHIALSEAKQCSAFQFVESALEALSKARGERVGLGIFPTNAFLQEDGSHDGSHGELRELLIDLFRRMGMRLSWQLLCVPGRKEFVLNIHQLLGASTDRVADGGTA